MSKSERLHISYCGGADFLVSHFATLGIWQKFDDAFEKRNARAEYTIGDFFQTWIMNLICGSNRLEQSYDNRINFLSNPHFRKGMSPDTISRIMRTLSVENTYYTRLKDSPEYKNKYNRIISTPTVEQMKVGNEVNFNLHLNEVTLDVALNLGLLKEGQEYDLDIDATIIPNKVSDARVHYKGTGTGYAPMVVMLGGIPLFMEMRNGNSNAAFRKREILSEAIELFEGRGLKIRLVRIDAAGSSKQVLDYLIEKGLNFFIRANQRRTVKKNTTEDWDVTENNKLKYSSSMVNIFQQKIRMVEYEAMEGRSKKIFAIYTNDDSFHDEEVVKIYNQRAAHENRFADLKELGWHYMPHREMKYNAVHLHVTIIANLFFLYSKRFLSEKVSVIKEAMKPKTFIRKFIRVAARWIKGNLEFIDRQREFTSLRGGT